MKRILVTVDETKGVIHPELHSQFIEFLGGCINDGIWVGEASEIPNYEGLRKDVVNALKELEPPVIRWPGGCYADVYHWRDGIGNKEGRPVTYNENFGTFELEDNKFGTHEFMKFCRLVGAKSWLNVNMMSGSIKEMREWMEYCNRKEPTTLAQERGKNGSAEAFGVEYWGIGNEVWSGGGMMTARQYADEYRKYAMGVPFFDKFGEKPKIEMKRIASGPDGNKPDERVRWTKEFFQALSEYRMPPTYGYDLHYYNWNLKNLDQSELEFDRGGWDEVIQGCLELEQVIKEQYALVQEGISGCNEPNLPFSSEERQCHLIVGEWGNWHGSAFKSRPVLYQQCTMRDAITTALTLDIFHRNCERVRLACVAQSVNVLNSLFLTEGRKFVKTPNYDVFEMYKIHRGAQMVPLKEDNAADGIYTFISRKGDMVNVNLVNTDFSMEKEVCLVFQKDLQFIRAVTLSGDSPNAYNSFDNPDRVRAKEGREPIKGKAGFRILLPEASVNVYQFEVIVREDFDGKKDE